MVKRYKPVCWDSTGSDITEDSSGYLVLYSDYKALEDKYNALVKVEESKTKLMNQFFNTHD